MPQNFYFGIAIIDIFTTKKLFSFNQIGDRTIQFFWEMYAVANDIEKLIKDLLGCRFIAISVIQRWTKKNGPSSGWAFVPRTARSGWEVPFCSEAVISALCVPCPRARAAAWSSATIRSLCGRYMRHGRKSWKMQIPQKSWSDCENFCKYFTTKKPPRQQLQTARRGGVLQ